MIINKTQSGASNQLVFPESPVLDESLAFMQGWEAGGGGACPVLTDSNEEKMRYSATASRSYEYYVLEKVKVTVEGDVNGITELTLEPGYTYRIGKFSYKVGTSTRYALGLYKTDSNGSERIAQGNYTTSGSGSPPALYISVSQ